MNLSVNLNHHHQSIIHPSSNRLFTKRSFLLVKLQLSRIKLLPEDVTTHLLNKSSLLNKIQTTSKGSPFVTVSQTKVKSALEITRLGFFIMLLMNYQLIVYRLLKQVKKRDPSEGRQGEKQEDRSRSPPLLVTCLVRG